MGLSEFWILSIKILKRVTFLEGEGEGEDLTTEQFIQQFILTHCACFYMPSKKHHLLKEQFLVSQGPSQET